MTSVAVPALLPPGGAMTWDLPGAGGGFTLRQPASMMGVINVTPDSFSDGGTYRDAASAIGAGERQVAAGAAWLDIGGESSRPGAMPVDVATECVRVLPVIAGLRERRLRVGLSIDTSKAEVARAAIGAGAHMINDITAGTDPDMFGVVASGKAIMVLMHMQGTPATMQQDPRYADVVDDILAYLGSRMALAVAAGIDERNIVLDPGLGFGKTARDNLALLRSLPRFTAEFARPVLVGVSRKSFLDLGAGCRMPAAGRDPLSHVLHGLLAAHCALLRVHDVAGALAACRLVQAVRDGGNA